MRSKPETNFRQSKVIPFLKTLTHTCAFPIQQLGIRGTPDMLLCSRGLFIALELKADNGSLSALQEFNLREVEEKSLGISFVASPKNWKEIKARLKKLDEGDI